MSAQALPGGVKPITGPSALAGDPRRFLHLTWTLAVLDFRLKFFGSVLGYVWQLMKPLLLFGVMLFVFTKAVRLGGGVTQYPVVLLSGIVMFTFFAESTSAAVSSVVDREALVRKIHFPRLVIPLSVVLTAYFNLVLNYLAVVIFMLARGVAVRWSWLELIPLVLFLGLFSTGLSMILSSMFVRFRDVRPIWEVALQAIFYGSAIFYPIEKIPSVKLQHLIMCNPLAAVVQQIRHAVIDPGAPTAGQAIGGDVRLLIPLVLVLILVGGGFWWFNREAPRIAEEL
ncbi:MAG TPA: ABC transporter permease [Thermoleophilaceae bacterium]|nr:ABC transporter permease [Thermoleophilaceae bacterium]